MADLSHIQEFIGINVLADGIVRCRKDKSRVEADQDNQTDEAVNLFHGLFYNLVIRKSI